MHIVGVQNGKFKLGKGGYWQGYQPCQAGKLHLFHQNILSLSDYPILSYR